MLAMVKNRSAAKEEGERFTATPIRPRWIEGATRRKSAVVNSVTIQTPSSRSDLVIDRQLHADGRTSPDTISLSARRHNDMKRNELQSASTNPTVNHPLLDEERAQRSISSETCDSAGNTPRSTFPMDALKSRGRKRLSRAIAMATKGTSDSARKKATSAAALSSGPSLAIAVLGLAQSMVDGLIARPSARKRRYPEGFNGDS